MFGKKKKWRLEAEEMRADIRYLNQYLEYIESHLEEMEERLHKTEPPSSWQDQWDDTPAFSRNPTSDEEIMRDIKRQIDAKAKDGKPFFIRLILEDF